MRVSEPRRRPSDEDDDRNTPLPPYVKEPEPDVPDPDNELLDVSRPVETISQSLQSCV